MLRIRVPVFTLKGHYNLWTRGNSSSTNIRKSFIEYFVVNHGHKHVKSSAVVPLCDSTLPFVNAGMNQFKGVFLGTVKPPCDRAVNSQKCVRVGGKHNDLEVVGTDGHHHTFFEMLGNWSFGNYYKKEASEMAWDLLLGPYRLKPENLVVTYFSGDVLLDLKEDTECRDIWKKIGVPSSRLIGKGSADNFWEMGTTGPCGPCTEIHYVNADGSLTEIWNLVFIQYNRGADGKISALRRRHVDTGMGLERMAAILQRAPNNYETDLFRPIIDAIQRNSSVPAYSGAFSTEAALDCAYRRLADHARMISVCLADDVFPSTSLNLKQIMRKSFKISEDIFRNPRLLTELYDEVAQTLGPTYPELITKKKQALLIMEHEQMAYEKMRKELGKKWKELVKRYPEVEEMADVEASGFPLGYKEFKETMSKHKLTEIPGDLVFKLYDTHGFQEETIERIATLNNLTIDKKGFWKLLSQHKSRHKTAFKEQTSDRGIKFDEAIDNIIKKGVTSTNDQPKYDYSTIDDRVIFNELKTNVVAILNEDCEWIDCSEPSDSKPYYLVTKDTNFFCEEGGQIADSGVIKFNDNIEFKVKSVFKIRDFVFHKGCFKIVKSLDNKYVKCGDRVVLTIDSEKRLNVMRNHTGVHLLNAAVRKMLPNSVVCQIGSGVSDKGFHLSLSVYGEKLSQKVLMGAQELVRRAIQANSPVHTQVTSAGEVPCDALTVPGETYPEVGLRVVQVEAPGLSSKELCCGTHTLHTGELLDVCVTRVRGAGGAAPTVCAVTGERAGQVRELFSRARKMSELNHLIDPDRREEEISATKRALTELCGAGGAPAGEYKLCLDLLDSLPRTSAGGDEMALQAIAQAELAEAEAEAGRAGRGFCVHFLRCSYLLPPGRAPRALGRRGEGGLEGEGGPVLALGCAGGVIVATCNVPESSVTDTFNAHRWLSCIAPVFKTTVVPPTTPGDELTYAEMTPAKVSLITCEQLVQDAMRVAVKYAQAHGRDKRAPGQGRQLN